MSTRRKIAIAATILLVLALVWFLITLAKNEGEVPTQEETTTQESSTPYLTTPEETTATPQNTLPDTGPKPT